MEIIKYNQKLLQRARDLRNKSTFSERILWNYLKQKKIRGLQFFRQRPIDNYILDFYCPEVKLAIEIDGEIHEFSKEEDIDRQDRLESYGIRFLRFKNTDVEKYPKAVVATIINELNISP